MAAATMPSRVSPDSRAMIAPIIVNSTMLIDEIGHDQAVDRLWIGQALLDDLRAEIGNDDQAADEQHPVQRAERKRSRRQAEVAPGRRASGAAGPEA